MKKILSVIQLCVFALFAMGSSYANAQDTHTNNPNEKCCQSQYGSFYTKAEAIVAPEHAIPFCSETLCHTKAIEHPEGTGEFILKEPGIYRVTYSVSLRGECAPSKETHHRNIALTLDGHVVQGSEMFIAKDDHLSTLSLLVKVCGSSCCDHVLRVINNNPLIHGWHNIHLKAGPYCNNITASITIEKMACCPIDCLCK